MSLVSDEEYAKRLQAELDAEVAGPVSIQMFHIIYSEFHRLLENIVEQHCCTFASISINSFCFPCVIRLSCGNFSRLDPEAANQLAVSSI